MMVLLLLAASGFLIASRRISLRNYCTANDNCASCGLRRVCNSPEENKVKPDEEKEKI
jgi:hypothetical protein